MIKIGNKELNKLFIGSKEIGKIYAGNKLVWPDGNIGSEGGNINTNGYDYVDLGLPSGLLWATCNIGATKPEEYGLYFAWGETKGYKNASEKERGFTWDTYKFGTEDNLTKYNEIDGLTVLELEDDAAHVNMGGDWRMPTKEEFQELLDNTVAAEGTTYSNGWIDNYNGTRIKGILRKSVINDAVIFLPASGYCIDSKINWANGSVDYRSSSLNTKYNYYTNAYYLRANTSTLVASYTYDDRTFGGSIRGVISKFK